MSQRPGATLLSIALVTCVGIGAAWIAVDGRGSPSPHRDPPPLRVAHGSFATSRNDTAGPSWATAGPFWVTSSRPVLVHDLRVLTHGAAQIEFLGWIDNGTARAAAVSRYPGGFTFSWPVEFSSGVHVLNGPDLTLKPAHYYLLVVGWTLKESSSNGAIGGIRFVATVAHRNWAYGAGLSVGLCPFRSDNLPC